MVRPPGPTFVRIARSITVQALAGVQVSSTGVNRTGAFCWWQVDRLTMTKKRITTIIDENSCHSPCFQSDVRSWGASTKPNHSMAAPLLLILQVSAFQPVDQTAAAPHHPCRPSEASCLMSGFQQPLNSRKRPTWVLTGNASVDRKSIVGFADKT